MPKTFTFLVNDENVLNSYGFRWLTSGINTVQYEKNPIVLWYHKRPDRWEGNDESERFPIGLAHNLRKEMGKLFADIEFDEQDDFASKIMNKVERGFLRMCSGGFEPVTTSSDAQYLLPGQKYETIVTSNLIEISIVDIGAHPDALRLYKDKKLVTLSPDGDNDIVPRINTDKQTTTSMDFMKKVAVLLALNPDASEDSIMQVLQGRINLAKDAETFKGERDQLSAQIKELAKANIITLVDNNVDKKFTADKRDQLIKLGTESGYDTLKSVIELMPEMVKPSGQINLSTPNGPKKVEKFEDLIALGADTVEQFRNENREEYVKLYKEHFGFAPKFDE